jgi:hypothetical protein
MLLALLAVIPAVGSSPGVTTGDPLGVAGAAARRAVSEKDGSAAVQGRGCNLCGSAEVTHGVLWMDVGDWRAEYCRR